jgi:hypothetical protein
MAKLHVLEPRRRRFSWGWVGVATGVLTLVGALWAAAGLAADVQFKTEADAKYATKEDVRRIEDAHKEDHNEIRNTRENLIKLMGRFGVEPTPIQR